MKRIICLILLVVMVLTVLVGCAEMGKDSTTVDNSALWNVKVIDCEYFESEVVHEGDAYVVIRDVNTDVLYLVIGGFRTATMTPLYNSDGTIQTYKEG